MAIDCRIHVAHRLTVAVLPGVQQGRCTTPQITEVYGDFIFESPDSHHEAIDICKQNGTTSAILRLITSDLRFCLISPGRSSGAHVRAYHNSGLEHWECNE